MNIWQNTTLCNGDVSKKLVQLLVVSNGELQMSWNDTGLLVVSCCVASQLKDFGSQVLENGSQVHRCTSTDSLSVVALSEKSVNSTDWESETSLRRSSTAVSELVLQDVLNGTTDASKR